MTAADGGRSPIACSLDAAALRERADEWRALVASSVTSVEVGRGRACACVLDVGCRADARRWHWRSREGVLPLLRRVAGVEADRRTLVLAVPDGAEEAAGRLRGLIALTGSDQETTKGASPSASMPNSAMASATTEGFDLPAQGELLQHGDDQVGAVDLEVGAQRVAGVGAPEAVGPE